MSELPTNIWEKISIIQDDLFGLGFTIFAAILFYMFRSKVKLIYGRANKSRNVVKVPDQKEPEKSSSTEIYIEKFFLQNVGRKSASNVEFVLSHFPTDVSVHQPRDVKYIPVEKGDCLISIPQIAPGELVIIDCAYINQKAAFVSSVKCAECLGSEVPFWTVRQFSSWINASIMVALFLGIAFVIQLLVKLFGGL